MKDRRPVVFWPVQNPSQELKNINPLYALRVVFSCEAERPPFASARDYDIPPPPPNMHVLIAPLNVPLNEIIYL